MVHNPTSMSGSGRFTVKYALPIVKLHITTNQFKYYCYLKCLINIYCHNGEEWPLEFRMK